jgi:hypothetical protein
VGIDADGDHGLLLASRDASDAAAGNLS